MSIEGILMPCMMIGAGVYLFFNGFRTLQSSRTIQNIPTSRISTGAVGTHVEIKGKILKDEVRSKNNSHWKTIDQFFSSPDIIVDDQSGAVAKVFVAGAAIQRQGKVKEFEISSNEFASMPMSLTQALELNANQLQMFKLKDTSWLLSNQYRFLEWCFAPAESVYVMGYAESGIKAPKRKKLSFDNFMKAKKTIEANPSLQNRYDRDQDGFLSPEELERGAQAVGHGLQVEAPPIQEKTRTPDIKMVFRKQQGVPYILSNMKETDLVKRLSWTATLKVWGGPVLAIGGATYLFITKFYL
jgi:hypothetical protein